LVTENRLFSAFFLSFVDFFWFSGKSPGGTPDYQRPPPADQPADRRRPISPPVSAGRSARRQATALV